MRCFYAYVLFRQPSTGQHGTAYRLQVAMPVGMTPVSVKLIPHYYQIWLYILKIICNVLSASMPECALVTKVVAVRGAF